VFPTEEHYAGHNNPTEARMKSIRAHESIVASVVEVREIFERLAEYIAYMTSKEV
jgi:hypothetical protein